MSDYLVCELEHYGVAVGDLSEIAALDGAGGQLEAVTLVSGERLVRGRRRALGVNQAMRHRGW